MAAGSPTELRHKGLLLLSMAVFVFKEILKDAPILLRPFVEFVVLLST
jgi:hypothetical protein